MREGLPRLARQSAADHRADHRSGGDCAGTTVTYRAADRCTGDRSADRAPGLRVVHGRRSGVVNGCRSRVVNGRGGVVHRSRAIYEDAARDEYRGPHDHDALTRIDEIRPAVVAVSVKVSVVRQRRRASRQRGKGYPLKGQQIAESASGAKLVKISLEVSHLDKAKLAAEMRSLNPDFKVVSVEGAQTAAPSIKDMADRFPDIASLVRAYGESFGSESRDRELLDAGKKIPAFP